MLAELGVEIVCHSKDNSNKSINKKMASNSFFHGAFLLER